MTSVVDPELLHAPIIALNPDTTDKVAFVTEDDTLLYSQLRKITLQGSKWLRESGCQPGDCIGICLPKGVETVEVIFATLAAGAVFLPIDPNAPPARVAYLLSDAGANRLFTYPRMAESLDQLEQVIHSDVTVLEGKHSFQNMLGEITPDEILADRLAQDTALLYYTSGTTGMPKASCLAMKMSPVLHNGQFQPSTLVKMIVLQVMPPSILIYQHLICLQRHVLVLPSSSLTKQVLNFHLK